MKKLIALLLVTAMLCTVFTACSAKEEKAPAAAAPAPGETAAAAAPEAAPEMTLGFSWWGNQTRTELTQAASELYTSLNPNITFELMPLASNEYWDKMTTLAAGGELPILNQQDYGKYMSFVDNSLLAGMNEFISSSVIDTSDIPDAYMGGGTVNGEVYAISMGVNSPCLVYNKTLLDSAGIQVPQQPTWEEFYALAQEVYDQLGLKTSFGSYYGPQHQIQLSIRQGGGHVFETDASGKIVMGFDDVALVERAFAMYEYGYTSGLGISGEWYAGPTSVELMPIVTGETWCEFLNSNQVVALQKATEDELAMVMNPEFSDKVANGLYLKPSMLISISAQASAEEQLEAAKVINFLINSTEANEVLKAERGVPINSTVREALKGSVDEVTAMTFDYISLVEKNCSDIDEPDPSFSAQLNAKALTLMQGVVYGQMTAKDAAAEWMRTAQSLVG